MLGPAPRALQNRLARPFTFKRGTEFEIPVLATLRGVRAGELVNSETQANAFLVVDVSPLKAAGIEYLLKFDRFISEIGESYTVQESRVAFDATKAVFHKCFVLGGGAS